MQRFLSILLLFILVFSITGCNKKQDIENINTEISQEEKIKEENVVIEEDLLLDFETVPDGVIAKSMVFSANEFSVATVYVYENKIEVWHTENKEENSKLIETFDFNGTILKSEIDKLENNPEFIIYEDTVLLEQSVDAIVVYNSKLPEGIKVNYTGVHAYTYRENSKQAEKVSKMFSDLIFKNDTMGVYSKVKELVE